ncbi:MAG: hypothetical protein ACT4P7_13305 [Gemmatimonadaceae bacterium]
MSHELQHRGQGMLALKQNGLMMKNEVAIRVWSWQASCRGTT